MTSTAEEASAETATRLTLRVVREYAPGKKISDITAQLPPDLIRCSPSAAGRVSRTGHQAGRLLVGMSEGTA
jgi:uncharacterized protein (DUF2267 family)